MDKQKNRPPSNLHRNGHCGVFHPRVAIGDYRLFDPNDPGLPSFLPLLFPPPPPPPPIDSHRLKTAQVEIRFQEKHLQNNKECFLLFLFVFFFSISSLPSSPTPSENCYRFQGIFIPWNRSVTVNSANLNWSNRCGSNDQNVFTQQRLPQLFLLLLSFQRVFIARNW